MEFIYEIDNAISKEMCDKLIKRFQNDDRKGPSKTFGGVQRDVRKSTILHFSGLDDWKDLDNEVFKIFTKCIKEYGEYVKSYTSGVACEGIFENLTDEGYFIQEYRSGEFYKWHTDDAKKEGVPRNLTCLLYLNTLEEDQGGTTDFWCGKKVKPKQGKMLIFPSCWTYVHRGAPVKNGGVKYVCGTWAA